MFDESWNKVGQVIAYGFGQVGKKYIDIFEKHFRLKCIVDNNCTINLWRGIPIVTINEMINLRNNEKIIVFASRTIYLNIKKNLEKYGLKESEDFCKFDDFLTNWHWKFRRENVIREVHTSIITNCTFRCKNCNMFMPYYKCNYQYNLEELEKDFDLLFSRVDYVYVYSLLGGEPFLNRDLGRILMKLNNRYSKKIGRIEIITNGSLIPNNKLLEILKKCNVTLRISDYSKQISYKEKLEQLCKILTEQEIEYSLESNLLWTDFMFPNSTCEKIIDIKSHMLCCAPEFHGLNDGKFYYCHVAWSAEKAGLIKLKKTDYIELSAIIESDKKECRKIVEHANGKIDSGYVSLCEFCMGCGDDNKNFIPVGEQL